jgi:hypothetical protein
VDLGYDRSLTTLGAISEKPEDKRRRSFEEFADGIAVFVMTG